ncbi:DUF1961 family protein [Cerasicoccus arenae]|uniref:Uncharacterized protein n=1 Tax=Cerasicoccus arenae TaxID=424488 RepID=A0A8J3GDD8_9BACT|nr:DUF1961 family protein [Cerasicoccus arenae]MBK1857601.1 DUF1961 family protein [Cerasicoccus arenae]GHC05645.1 hypothetical protein GCM10007047_23240 [Cerasicoccus arenae]
MTRTAALSFAPLLATASFCWASDESTIRSEIDWEYPVYRSNFTDETVLGDWVLEGGESMQVIDGCFVLESEGLQTRPAPGNHLVAWLKPEIPADFYLEFDFRPEDKSQGLAIIFFNTRGTQGEPVLDPDLAPRDGTFVQYHSGDLDGYHLSYWSGARKGVNLRKNHGFTLLGAGQDLIVADSTDEFQRVGLYKRGGTIRYFVDGELALEYVDDGETAGPIWEHSGWLGLRQMDHAHRCQYDNLAIYPLKGGKG